MPGAAEANARATPSLVLGRYRPLRPLGRGGSGSVWLARDERTSRDVALKVIPRDGKAGSRAEREVEAAARLRHPRCLRALALDRDDDHVYVAYEYVRGKTLRDSLRGGELDDACAVEAAAQVLDALAHAHGKGVVHRDVKPANVMLEAPADTSRCQAPGHVSVRLLDFGLAHLDRAETLTAAGDVPGTLAYIAPERLEGARASGAADVWAVGVMLWEALAGMHPFAAASPVETARRIAAGAPSLARARPDLPRELAALVTRMLALDPRKRPPAKRLAAELRGVFAARAERPRALSSRRILRERTAHALLAAAFAGGASYLVPFFPRGWPLALAAIVGAAALRSPRAGLALALAVPVLPIGNGSAALALAYAALGVGWFALFARDARSSLLFVVAPALAPAGALALAPVVALRARGAVRRAAQGAAAVLSSLGTAAVAGVALPLTGEAARAAPAVDGADGPAAAASAVGAFAAAHPTLVLEAAVFAAAALAAPYARRRDLWGIAVWGAGFLAASILLPPLAGFPSPTPLALALGAWASAAVLAVPVLRTAR